MTRRYAIRRFSTIEEYRACVELQEETWGSGFSERVPPAILKVSQILGGVAAGAYDPEGELVGFVFGMTGPRDGELVHWSDMLAVRPEARDTGLGRELKAFQRDEVMALGVKKMFWTFDPLQARNAHLNFNRLGIVAREYVRDMYGQTDSPLHRGIGTDRFVALWLLDSERVVKTVASWKPGVTAGTVHTDEETQTVGPDLPIALDADDGVPHPGPVDSGLPPGRSDAVGVRIPSEIGSVMRDDPELAVAWRTATRRTFIEYLKAGYEVSAFERGTSVSTYVVTRIGAPLPPTEAADETSGGR